MSHAETVRAFVGALEERRWDVAAEYVTDDFVARVTSDGHTQAEPAARFFEIQRIWQDIFPGWSFNLYVEWERGNVVVGTIHIRGIREQAEEDERAKAAADVLLVLPRMDVRFTFSGRRIASLAVELPPGAQLQPLAGTLSQAMSRSARISGALPAKPRVAEVVAAAQFPVYGIVSPLAGLALSSLGYRSSSQARGDPGAVDEVTFGFAVPENVVPQTHSISIVSRLHPTTTDWRDLPRDKPIYHPDGPQYERFATLDAALSAGAPPAFWLIETLPLGNDVFAARVTCFGRSPEDWSFDLRDEKVQLALHITGFTHGELPDVLRALGPVNQSGALLARYQEELAAREKHLRERFGRPEEE